MNRFIVSLFGSLSVYLLITCQWPWRQGGASLDKTATISGWVSSRISRRFLSVKYFVFIGLVITGFLVLPSASLLFIFMPFFICVLQRLAERRKRRKMEEQLPDALALIGNAMSAGFSLVQAISMVAREVAEPLGGLFRRVVASVNLGVSVDKALAEAAKEIRSEDFDTVAVAIAIQRTTGGNLPRILEIVADTVREKQRLAGKLKSLTAQGKLTAVIVALLPVLLLIVMANLMPSYISPLLREPVGRLLLVLAAVLEIVGLWMINRMTTLSF